uniref:hypothetical protein n=1 Tax=Acetatifactor sp. TaxID=1872090 RepID=UPI00405602E7
MQINGMGSGHDHSMHQVTQCRHEHSVSSKQQGGAASSASANLQTQTASETQQEGQISLSAWLKNTLSGGKKLLAKIWGDSAQGASEVQISGENILQTEEQEMVQLNDPKDGTGHTPQNVGIFISSQELAATAALRQPLQESNPYFSAIEDTGREKRSIWEKVKVTFHAIAGQLLGRFSSKNSLYTKQEKPKEDLRKHSRYREDDLEIDCILTDDSYLMDSYDRKGEYSKLTTKK